MERERLLLISRRAVFAVERLHVRQNSGKQNHGLPSRSRTLTVENPRNLTVVNSDPWNHDLLSSFIYTPIRDAPLLEIMSPSLCTSYFPLKIALRQPFAARALSVCADENSPYSAASEQSACHNRISFEIIPSLPDPEPHSFPPAQMG